MALSARARRTEADDLMAELQSLLGALLHHRMPSFAAAGWPARLTCSKFVAAAGWPCKAYLKEVWFLYHIGSSSQLSKTLGQMAYECNTVS